MTCPTPGAGDIDPPVVRPSSTSSAFDVGEAQVLKPPRCSIVPSSAHRHHLRDRASVCSTRELDVGGAQESSRRPACLALLLGFPVAVVPRRRGLGARRPSTCSGVVGGSDGRRHPRARGSRRRRHRPSPRRAGARPRPTRRNGGLHRLAHLKPELAGEAVRVRRRAGGDYSQRGAALVEKGMSSKKLVRQGWCHVRGLFARVRKKVQNNAKG